MRAERAGTYAHGMTEYRSDHGVGPDDGIGPDTRDAVLERLGLRALPAPDLDGLGTLYRAWGRGVPFDNVRKLIALHGGVAGPLPGDTAEDFFDGWLRHGAGGTCWPTANALRALLVACGFDSRRLAASMAETGVATHGTTIVTLGGHEYLVDSSMLTDRPLLLDREHPSAIEDPIYGTTAEPVPEGWRFVFQLSFVENTIPCRTMSSDEVPHAFYSQRYEISRESSPFNTEVRVRLNTADGVISYGGRQRCFRDVRGIDAQACEGDALRSGLVDELGMSEEIVEVLLDTWSPPVEDP